MSNSYDRRPCSLSHRQRHISEWLFITASSTDEYDEQKKTEQNLTVCSAKSEAELTNSIRRHSRYRTAEANYRQTQSIAWPLCNSRDSCLFYLDTFIFPVNLTSLQTNAVQLHREHFTCVTLPILQQQMIEDKYVKTRSPLSKDLWNHYRYSHAQRAKAEMLIKQQVSKDLVQLHQRTPTLNISTTTSVSEMTRKAHTCQIPNCIRKTQATDRQTNK